MEHAENKARMFGSSETTRYHTETEMAGLLPKKGIMPENSDPDVGPDLPLLPRYISRIQTAVIDIVGIQELVKDGLRNIMEVPNNQGYPDKEKIGVVGNTVENHLQDLLGRIISIRQSMQFIKEQVDSIVGIEPLK